MSTTVNSAASEYFRCYRLAATITPQQCRLNRERCTALLWELDPVELAIHETRAPCLNCPQAKQVDTGRVRRFTATQVARGYAQRQPATDVLPGETRYTALPSEHAQSDLTSHFWVPPWEH